MLQRVKLSILTLTIFLLSGCISASTVSSNSNKKNTQSIGSTVAQGIVQPLAFDKLNGYFGVSKNSDIGYSRYLFLYGTVGTIETDNSRLTGIYNPKYSQIDFFDKDKKVYSSQNLDWEFNDSASRGKNITLMVPCQMKATVDKFQFNKIVLYSKEGKQAFDVGNYHVTFFKTAETKRLSCVEAPFGVPDPDIDITLSYAVMMTENSNSSEYDFRLETVEAPDWKIERTEWLYDEDLTKQMKTEYSSMKTEKELQYLKVYRVNTHTILPSKINFAIKPVISANIDGEKIYCTTEPFFLKF